MYLQPVLPRYTPHALTGLALIPQKKPPPKPVALIELRRSAAPAPCVISKRGREYSWGQDVGQDVGQAREGWGKHLTRFYSRDRRGLDGITRKGASVSLALLAAGRVLTLRA